MQPSLFGNKGNRRLRRRTLKDGKADRVYFRRQRFSGGCSRGIDFRGDVIRILPRRKKNSDGRKRGRRVIARPFLGQSGHFYRTSRRHDFSLPPTGETMLDILKENGLETIGIGKISDIFAGRGLTQNLGVNRDNADGMTKFDECLGRAFRGLCFVNLVDFDMLYGASERRGRICFRHSRIRRSVKNGSAEAGKGRPSDHYGRPWLRSVDAEHRPFERICAFIALRKTSARKKISEREKRSPTSPPRCSIYSD